MNTETLREIADLLVKRNGYVQERGIARGTLGFSLYLFHYARLANDETYYNKAFDMLDAVHEIVADPRMAKNDSLEIEVGWLFCYLLEFDFIDIDIDAVLDTIDDHAHSKCMYISRKELNEYLVEVGVYFTMRYAVCNNPLKKARIEEALIGIIDELRSLYPAWKKKYAVKKNGSPVEWPGFYKTSRTLSNIAIIASKIYNAGICKSLTGLFLEELYQDLVTLASDNEFISKKVYQEQRGFTRLSYAIYAIIRMSKCLGKSDAHEFVNLITYPVAEAIYQETSTLYIEDLVLAISLLELLNMEELPIDLTKEIQCLQLKLEQSLLTEKIGNLYAAKGTPDLGLKEGVAGAGMLSLSVIQQTQKMNADLLVLNTRL